MSDSESSICLGISIENIPIVSAVFDVIKFCQIGYPFLVPSYLIFIYY